MAEDVVVLGVGFDTTGGQAAASALAAQLGLLGGAANGAGAAMTRAGASAKGMGAAMSGAAGAVGLALGVFVTLGAVLAGATKRAGEFGEGMGLVATLLPGASGRVRELSARVLELDGDNEELTRGLFQTISAFGDSERAIASLNESYRAAVAGGSTVKEAVDLQISATKAFGDTSEAARKRVLDLAFETNRIGVTTFPELANSMGNVTGIANNLGLTIEEVFAGFATLTGAVGNTNEASTAFKATLSALGQGAGEMTKVFKDLGVETGQQLIAKFGGFGGAMDAVRDSAVRLGIPLQKVFNNVRAQKAALPLAAGLNQKYKDSLEAMSVAAGSADQAFIDATTGAAAFGYQSGRLKQRMDKLKIAVGAPFAEELAGTFKIWADALDRNQGKIVAWGKLVGRVMILVGSAFKTTFVIFKNFIEVMGLGFESLIAGLIADAVSFGVKFAEGVNRNILGPINKLRELVGNDPIELIDTSGLDALGDKARIKQKEFSDAAIDNLGQAQAAAESLAQAARDVGLAYEETLAEGVRDAARNAKEAAEGIEGLFGAGGPGDETGAGAGTNPQQEALDAYITGLQQEQEELGKTRREVLKLKAARLGGGEAQFAEIDRLEDLRLGYESTQKAAQSAAAANDRWAEQLKQIATQDIALATNRIKEQVDTFTRSFSDAVVGIVDGTKSIGEAFKGMVDVILAELTRLATQQLVGGLLGNLFSGGGGVSIGADSLGVSMPGGIQTGDAGGGFVPIPDTGTISTGSFSTSRFGSGGGGGSMVVEAPVNINISAIDSFGAQEILQREGDTIAGIVANKVRNSYSYRSALQGSV